jgi:hypothetical protein
MATNLTHPDEVPPDTGYYELADAHTVEICVAWCCTCKEIIGPISSTTVGETLALKHQSCDFDIIDTWDAPMGD